MFSRVIYGTRYSLGMAFAIVVPAGVLGVVIGLTAGYVGGRVDQVLMRLVDVFFAFPYFVLAMATASAMVAAPGFAAVPPVFPSGESRIASTSRTQLPHPVLARVLRATWATVRRPPARIADTIVPRVTALHEQISSWSSAG